MHKRLSQVLVALLMATLWFGVAGTSAAPAYAAGGTIFLPFASTQSGDDVAGSTSGGGGTFISGNPSCADLGYSNGFKPSVNGVESFTGTHTFNYPGAPSETVTVTSDGTYVDWSSTLGIDAVIVKGGPNANKYTYVPKSYGANGLHAPYNFNSGHYYGMSHVEFCYNVDATVIIKKVSPDDGNGQEFDFRIKKYFNGNYYTITDGTFSLEIGGEKTYDLTPGWYKVDEENIPSGWSLTDKSCSEVGQDVAVATGGGDGGYNFEGGKTYECVFTNEVDKGKIKVKKYNDVNVNDKRDDGEDYLSGWTVVVSGTALSGVTDADNWLVFEVPVGQSYEVCEVLQPGWQPSTGDLCETVYVADKYHPKYISFGNYRESEIVVKKFTNIQTDQVFPFEVTVDSGEIISGEASFNLGDGGVQTLVVKPGDYSVTETVASLVGWTLAGSSCYTEPIELVQAATFGVCIAGGGGCPPPPPPPTPPTLPPATRLVCEFHNEIEAQPLVTKNVTATYTTTYTWEITKTVAPLDQSAFAGETIDWTWAVTVGTNSTEGSYLVAGQISVENTLENDSVSGTLADELDDNTVAEITGCSGDGVTYAGGILTLVGGATAVCDYIAHPSSRDAMTNMATFTSGNTAFTGEAAVTWQETVVDGTAVVDDEQEPDFGDGLTINAENMPQSWTETQQYTCSTNPADYAGDGQYSDLRHNTATVNWDDDQSDDAYAETAFTCYGPVVTKDAAGTYDERHDWDVLKTVDPASQSAFAGESVSWDWTILVTETTADENFAVTGVISVTNPAGSPGSMEVSLADLLNDGTIANVDCGGGSTLTVASGATETCTYTAAPTDDIATSNTVTATFNAIDFTALAGVAFTKNVVNGEATLSDTEIGLTDEDVTGGNTFSGPGEALCSSNPADYADGGKYTVEVSNTATLTDEVESEYESTAKTTYTCYGPVVEKDATALWEQGTEWSLEKSVTPASAKKFAGESATFDYTVVVTKANTDKFTVSGLISVTNPAGSPGAMNVSLADLLPGGTGAVIDCGAGATSVSVDPGQTKGCAYTGELGAKIDGTNTVTATFNTIDFTATAGYEFGDAVPGGEPESVTVQDVYDGGSAEVLGVTSESHTYTYSRTEVCSSEPGDYTNGFDSTTYANTASIQETTGDSDSAQVTLDCYAPIVSKDADPEWQREYGWNIEKSVDPAAHAGIQGDTFTSFYTVTVSRIVTDSGFMAFGTISVTNPAGAPGPMTVDVADQVGASTSTVDCGAGATSVTVAAGATETCSYSMPLPDASNLVNTATVTFNEIDFEADADVIFGDPTVVGFSEINVSDAFNGGDAGNLGSANGDKTFTYSRPFECPADAGMYDDSDSYSASFPNIAKINETGQQADANVDVDCTLKTKTTSELSAVGDRVWFDEGKDGLQDPGDVENVGGVTVTLYSDKFAAPLLTDITDKNGIYGFTNLQPGRYCLEFQLPANTLVTLGNQGNQESDDEIDSDNDNITLVDGVTRVRTSCFDLTPGETDLSWDLGIYDAPVPTNEDLDPQPDGSRTLFLPTLQMSTSAEAAAAVAASAATSNGGEDIYLPAVQDDN